MISIRLETVHDYGAIRELTIQAFETSDFGYHGEAELIDRLRENCGETLSLVALSSNTIVGHILFTPAVIRGEMEIHGMGLGPMSVAPGFQKSGIGSLLVTDGLQRLTDEQCSFVIVLGHPNYYTRFGFEPASRYGVAHGFSGIPRDVSFINLLDSTQPQIHVSGNAYFRPEFGPQHQP